MVRTVSRFSFSLLPVALLLVQVSTFAWGNSGHTNVNLNAARKIPQSMPAFLRTPSARARIAYLGPEPDRWRGTTEYSLNNAQAPDHFIDLERIQGLGDLPRGRYEFYKLLYAKRAVTKTNPDDYLPEKVGLQPYITMEVYERLKAAFREYRKLKAANQSTDPVEQDIIFYAGWLGHYVGDGSQPLHTSVDYDGWVEDNPRGFATGQGLHWAFEGVFVDKNIKVRPISNL